MENIYDDKNFVYNTKLNRWTRIMGRGVDDIPNLENIRRCMSNKENLNIVIERNKASILINNEIIYTTDIDFKDTKISNRIYNKSLPVTNSLMSVYNPFNADYYKDHWRKYYITSEVWMELLNVFLLYFIYNHKVLNFIQFIFLLFQIYIIPLDEDEEFCTDDYSFAFNDEIYGVGFKFFKKIIINDFNINVPNIGLKINPNVFKSEINKGHFRLSDFVYKVHQSYSEMVRTLSIYHVMDLEHRDPHYEWKLDRGDLKIDLLLQDANTGIKCSNESNKTKESNNIKGKNFDSKSKNNIEITHVDGSVETIDIPKWVWVKTVRPDMKYADSITHMTINQYDEFKIAEDKCIEFPSFNEIPVCKIYYEKIKVI